jgi:hypothetical protein
MATQAALSCGDDDALLKRLSASHPLYRVRRFVVAVALLFFGSCGCFLPSADEILLLFSLLFVVCRCFAPPAQACPPLLLPASQPRWLLMESLSLSQTASELRVFHVFLR